MSNVRAFPPPKSTQAEKPDWEKLVEGFSVMLEAFPPDQQQLAIDQLIAAHRPIPAPRAGEVLGTIVRFLPSKRDWTVAEIKDGVAARGVEASNKEIYNSLGYLVRKGRVKRVGYGQYIVDGPGR